MADPNFPLAMDDDIDDLPRTLRREHAARREEAEGGASRSAPAPELAGPVDTGGYAHGYDDEPYPATVKRIDVPFLRLMLFFIKAVLAAVPALGSAGRSRLSGRRDSAGLFPLDRSNEDRYPVP